MSKFDEILNSSDASDALLGEQIDKLMPVVYEVPVSNITVAGGRGTVVSHASNHVTFCKQGNHVTVSIYLRFNFTDTTACIVNIMNVIPADIAPLFNSQAITGVGMKYTSDTNIDTIPLVVQCNDDRSLGIYAVGSSVKINTLNDHSVNISGSYICK